MYGQYKSANLGGCKETIRAVINKQIMAKMKIIEYGFVGNDRTKVRIYTADGGVIEARRCPLPERLTCSGSKPALYCTRDGHFLSLTKLGLREIKPNIAQAGSRKCTHTNGNGTHYPFLRQFGAKHCHFLVAGAWYGPRPEGMVIDHLNGDILNWSAENLEYVTPEENRKRAKLLRVLRSIGREPRRMSYAELRDIFRKYRFEEPEKIMEADMTRHREI